MPQVTIDGRTYDFEPGQKLLQFCLDHGVEVPHFCYHPALSVPANCRQCLVKTGMPVLDRETRQPVTDADGVPQIAYAPKLTASCAADLADGMVVHTQFDAADVAAAQADNLELMLINHPLDCPICDQAGQCPLQIQAYKHGPEGSRFEFQKVHKPKRVQLGPNVVLDAERCINCTRCTRFTDEISGSHQLTIINRGDRNHPMTAPGQTFDDLYSMCTTDICPVGALTEDYFRFKARVWEMSKTPTVSDFGGKGINVDVWVRDNQVLRITPRANADVNQYWMPDAARLVFARYNEGRASGPTVGGAGASWDDAIAEAARLLADAGADTLFLGSPWATVEDNAVLAELAAAVGAAAPRYVAERREGAGDGWLISDDPAPNTAGVERLGFEAVDAATFAAQAAAAPLVWALQADPVAAGLVDAIPGAVVVMPTHTDHGLLATAAVSLPTTVSVESLGTYVSEDGRAQLLRPAKAIRSANRTLMMAMGVGQSRNDRQGTPFDRWHADDRRVDARPAWDVLPLVGRALGHEIGARSPAAVMERLAGANAAFAGATHAAMGTQGVALQDAAPAGDAIEA